MRRLLVTLILGVFLASAAGCADLGISNPFESTPTAANSQLLGISLPAGMELSTQHCARTTGSDGQPQGMETAYGQADRMQVAQSLFNNMQGAGWNVRMSLRKADRIMLAFENGNRLAVISLYSQTVYSCVAEIWVSEKMADGSSLNLLPLRGEGGQNSGGFGGFGGSSDGVSGGGFESNGPATAAVSRRPTAAARRLRWATAGAGAPLRAAAAAAVCRSVCCERVALPQQPPFRGQASASGRVRLHRLLQGAGSAARPARPGHPRFRHPHRRRAPFRDAPAFRGPGRHAGLWPHVRGRRGLRSSGAGPAGPGHAGGPGLGRRPVASGGRSGVGHALGAGAGL